MKIRVKLERLGEWEEGIKTKFEGTTREQKNSLANKLKAVSRSLA
jgi:hypothetical protein